MKRVHRKLSRDEVELLRARLAEQVPTEHVALPDLLRQLRLIVKMNQTEYAALCGISRAALSAIEAGRSDPTLSTVNKLLAPFGYCMGVVARPVPP